MAIHEGYDKINTITGLDVPWEGKTGVEVEDFISRRLAQPIGETIKYSGETLEIFNTEGTEVIASGKVTMVPPHYFTEILFPQLIVNGDTYDNNVEINYTSTSTFVAGINVKTYYESSGNFYNLSNKVKITFYIEGTTDQLIVDNIVPNRNTDDTLQYIDITPLFQKNLQGAVIKATVTANGETSTAQFAEKGTVTVHKIELSTTSTYVDNKTVVFNISGLKTTGGMFLEYFDVPLGADPTIATKQQTTLTGTSSTDLVLERTGAHQIVARISNTEGTFYSNWVQANVISYDSTSPEAMMAIIGGIPTTINNCENANLYKIIYVPGLGGEVEIISYLTDEAGNFELPDWDPYLFNRTSISTTSNDKASTSDYYSYIELTSVGSAQKALAFKMRLKEGGQFVEYPIYQLSVNNKGSLVPIKYFSIDIVENPYNVNNAFNYTEGQRDDFSQITGQATSVFNDINSNVEASDGWTTDENLITYKVSGSNTELFSKPKDFSSLLNSGQGFSIEVMLKNYNINGNDPVMNIGSLLFGPGYVRVNSEDLSDEGIFVNSRADFEKEVITHLMITYDPAYKPNTYLNIYDQIFNENGVTYSNIEHNYPILRIFVNGCINREIQINPEELRDDNGFKWQICPKSSDLNLYIFRTYTRALSYNEIQKNFISSRTTAKEKKDIYDRNDILAPNGRVSFYKSMLKHNVIVFVLPVGEKPLFFGNRDTAGDGKSKATILVRYKNQEYKDYNGRFTKGKYKSQGSSAKKYMFHNTQYSKGIFLSEAQIAAGETEGSNKYAIPTDPEKIQAKKLVGKVNYASSMQSHKQGATKLYDRAYKEIFPSGTLYNGGKKACLEEAFLYFYYNVDDDAKLDTITMEDLYTTTTVNNIVVAEDSNVKFFGFQTWGSAKADDPTYGYDEEKFPEYVLFEGADNGSPGANFKQPWAAFQTWDSTKTKKENQATSGAIVQQPKSVTQTDFTTGLLIEGETIQFENDTDPLDVDYGVELLILDGQTEKEAENRDLWKFNNAVKDNSLPYFVNFYNNCYQYDFTNLIQNPNSDKAKFDLTNTYESTNKRIYMTVKAELYEGDTKLGRQANALDVYRWDIIKERWVPAGLHYVGTDWEAFNLKTVYESLKNDTLYLKYKNNKSVIEEDFEVSIPSSGTVGVTQYVIPAFKDMFRATVEEYCDKQDIAYHQAFIRLVSGTDNRAKNTYFQIIGKKYEANAETGEVEKTETGDYKIRLMQDDLDTIFATDNNGQQVKPYYLLEPPFNTETESLWGDDHSSFFYPFDVCYSELVNEYVGKLITHLLGSATTIKSEDIGCNLYNYFFSVQKQFPEIAYNHHAEIYYEMPQVLFHNNEILKINGATVFPNTLNGFANNSVKNPLSLSHGRCLESEYQFMKDRLLLLGTSTITATGLYSSDRINVSTVSTGGDTDRTTLKGIATYTDYFYPIRSTNTPEYQKIGNITSLDETTIKPDEVFKLVLQYPHIPSIISQMVTPNKEFAISCAITTTMGSFLNAGSKYKTLTITEGLEYTHSLLNLPNAKSLIVDGNTAKYAITDSNITVKNYLPIIENLVITNTVFNDSVLDLRGCNRLESLNLSGCTGIVDIIFPENNRLTSVYLPTGLKKLTLGKNPNLANFVFAEGTYLTEISLDCSAFNPNFDYMDLLNNRIDYSNLNQFILQNTPEGGLMITESIATRLASIKINPDIVTLINGTYLINDRNEGLDDYNKVVYSWGNPTDISYNTKKYLVNAFGNIDEITNAVSFKYKSSTLMYNSYKLPALISIDAPNGGKFKPFDSLYFTEGNNVGITDDGLLNIYYRIDNLPGSCSFNNFTGELTVQNNTETRYSYKIIVTLTDGTALKEITGQLYLGYIEPAIGDYAYSDGTFSQVPNSDKTLVGMVFQKEVVTPGKKWNLGILSNSAINDYAGPDYYHWDNGSNGFSNYDTNGDQDNIYTFMKNANGLNISMPNGPTANDYLGFNTNYQTTGDDTVVGYDYLTAFPTSLVTSGAVETQQLTTVGLNRLKTIAATNKSPILYNYLRSQEFIDAQGEFTGKWTVTTFDEVCSKFDEGVRTNLKFETASNYYKVLHPLAFKASIFEPNNLTAKGVEYYAKGNWYIPSKEELELLIWYRIRSTATATSTKPESYWNDPVTDGGTAPYNIFSGKSIDFDAFLSGTMLASNVSTSNKNFVYGEVQYYTGTYVTVYGWFYNYSDTSGGWDTYHQNCRRDVKYSIAPCCTITVTKQS